MALKGIDVSKYQGTIDWNKAKDVIDFAILRCGYGSDIVKQDDSKFERNVAECERLGIPYAVYLYSYATDSMKVTSEICHVLRVIGNHRPFCIYFDMEDNSTTRLGKATLTSFAHKFCKAIEAQGFKAGVYANQHWFQTYLDVADLHKAGYSIWCAKYSDSKPNIAAPYDIWQYSSKGSVPGIVGNVDMNYMYVDIRDIAKEPTVEVTRLNTSELADAIIAGKFGNGDARKEALKKEGYTDAEIKAAQDEVNKRYAKPVKKSTDELAKEIIDAKWGNGDERIANLKKAGYSNEEIKAAQNKVNEMLKPKSNKLSTKELAKKMLRGEYGNGAARTKKLKSLGYTDSEIKAAQALINKGEVK